MKLEIEINVPEARRKDLFKEMVILVDSREKSNQHILNYFEETGIKYKIGKVEVGDYSFMLPANEFWDKDIYFTNHVSIERKNSLEELSGNFSADRLRLENELAEAYDRKVKLFMIIEGATYENMAIGKYNTNYNKAAFSASFLTFVDRYNLTPFFIPKDLSGKLIYDLCKYHLRNLIK